MGDSTCKRDPHESTHTVREAAPQAHVALATSARRADVDFYYLVKKAPSTPNDWSVVALQRRWALQVAEMSGTARSASLEEKRAKVRRFRACDWRVCLLTCLVHPHL